MPGIKNILPAALLFLLHIIVNCNSGAQTIVKPENTNERTFLVRTKQFNEFIDRFNYKTNFYGDPVDSVFMSKIPRGNMVRSLFNLKDSRTIETGVDYSINYVTDKDNFVNEVVNNNLNIYKYSDKIIAEAKSRIIYKGVPSTISIFLTQEIVGKDMVKWVIFNVKGDIFNFLKTDTAYIRFIPPSSNETDFINLKRALGDLDHLQYYSSKEYEPDYLTLFYYIINSRLASFEYVEEIIYHIIDIPGWSIQVREFNRNEMNSGWLISDISKNSLDRINYLKNLK